MLIFIFTSIPLLFISDIFWLGAAMLEFWNYFSYILPSTFGINGFVRINNMETAIEQGFNGVSDSLAASWGVTS